MSKKRTSAESREDEEATQGSGPVFQQEEDNAKRMKFSPRNDTTLRSLSDKLLDRILIKAVTMEVKTMKLAKAVWKQKAELVISRLKAVCVRWSNILTTNAFLSEVHRVLDDTGEEKIRLEILTQTWVHRTVIKVTTLKDEVLMLCSQNDRMHIVVFNRSNMNEVKDDIQLPGLIPLNMDACVASDCVFVLTLNAESNSASVARITRDAAQQFHLDSSPWITGLKLPTSSMSVTAGGTLVISHGVDPVCVCVYDALGSPVLSADIFGFKYIDRVIGKSNGNLILASVNGNEDERILTEIGTDGRIEGQYKSPLGRNIYLNFVDMYSRVMITNPRKGIQLLDSELNPLVFSVPQMFIILDQLHYSSDRNEVVSISAFDAANSLLTIFQLVEE